MQTFRLTRLVEGMFYGGPAGIWTRDLSGANRALFQAELPAHTALSAYNSVLKTALHDDYQLFQHARVYRETCSYDNTDSSGITYLGPRYRS